MTEQIQRWLDAIGNDIARDDLARDKKAQTQLAKAVAAPRVEFINRVILPNLPEIVIQPNAQSARDHAIAKMLAARMAQGAEVDWSLYTYFTNPLLPVAPKDDLYRSPSARVSRGRHHVFTFEYDDPIGMPLSVQFGWCRSPGKSPAQSVMGRLHADLGSRYADYFGMTVAWSGNKSLHIHLAFTTDLIPPLPADANLQEGFKAHWRLLRSVVASHTGHDRPDEACAGPSQYRRLPWGTHRNGNPQVVLWEAYRVRAAKNVTTSLFQPDPFLVPQVVGGPGRTRKEASGGTFTTEELAHVERRLGEHFSGWPHFVRLDHNSGGYRALFANSQKDANPASYMREHHRCVALVGTDSDTIHDAPVLPASLGRMMEIWRDELTLPKATTSSSTTYDEARQMLGEFIGGIAETATSRVLVHAPEGAGKTTSIMLHHHEFAAGGVSMYAFASYDIAREKAAQFNRLHAGSRYQAVLIESWSKLYGMCAEQRACPTLSAADAAKAGFPNLFEMVRLRQPEVLELMQRYCETVWEMVGVKIPAFFAVHDVAHLWLHHSPTRMIWSRAFWRSMNLRDAAALAETKLSLLVHDEASIDTFLSVIPAYLHRFAAKVAAKAKDVAELHQAYLAGIMTWKGPNKPSFEQVRRIIHRLSAYETVSVTGRGSYPDLYREINPHANDGYLSLYGADAPNAVGDWMIARNNWWRREDEVVAERIVILTTEELPSVCCPGDFEIARFYAPALPRDAVKVIRKRNLNRDGLVEIAGEVHERLVLEMRSTIRIVSNCLDGITTHAAAKGSDQFTGQHILQTAMFASPCRHEQLCALNDYLGREDCVILDHVDTINQTCGRNLGFRGDGRAAHYLLINRQLWALIESSPARNHLRYAVDASMDAEERRSVRRTVAKRRVVTPGLYDGSGYDAPILSFAL